jgi:hypothetical protein
MKRIPVSTRALTQRISRVLAKDGKVLRALHGKTRARILAISS